MSLKQNIALFSHLMGEVLDVILVCFLPQKVLRKPVTNHSILILNTYMCRTVET